MQNKTGCICVSSTKYRALIEKKIVASTMQLTLCEAEITAIWITKSREDILQPLKRHVT